MPRTKDLHSVVPAELLKDMADALEKEGKDIVREFLKADPDTFDRLFGRFLGRKFAGNGEVSDEELAQLHGRLVIALRDDAKRHTN